MDAEDGRRDSDGLCLARRYTRSRGRNPSALWEGQGFYSPKSSAAFFIIWRMGRL